MKQIKDITFCKKLESSNNLSINVRRLCSFTLNKFGSLKCSKLSLHIFRHMGSTKHNRVVLDFRSGFGLLLPVLLQSFYRTTLRYTFGPVSVSAEFIKMSSGRSLMRSQACVLGLQCFETVGWSAGRTHSLQKIES